MTTPSCTTQLRQSKKYAEREAEERRQKAVAAYKAFLNSAEGKEQHIKIANSYLARRRTASIWSLIWGLITILACLFCGVVFLNCANSLFGDFIPVPRVLRVFGESWLVFFILFVLVCTSRALFLKFWKKRSTAIPKVKDTNTGRVVLLTEAVQFLASRDISQDFAYEDADGNSCVPKPLIPDTSNTETAWR